MVIWLHPDIRAVTKLGKVVIHKAKRNNNLSFSKGKTWQLEDMRVLDVVGVSHSSGIEKLADVYEGSLPTSRSP